MPMPRVADIVRGMFLSSRVPAMEPEEQDLALHLRGNDKLLASLIGVIEARIAGRAKVPEPSDPIVAKSMIARDRELQWLVSRLQLVCHSLESPSGQGGEHLDD